MKWITFSFTRTAINLVSLSQVLNIDFILSSLSLIKVQIKVYVAGHTVLLHGKVAVSYTGTVFASQSLSEQDAAV